MTLDEAIKHCEEKAKELRGQVDAHIVVDAEDIGDCIECANEHEQLAEWLTELKALKENKCDWIIESQETSFYKIDSFKCSGCGWKVTEKSRFCPCCGARMNYQS